MAMSDMTEALRQMAEEAVQAALKRADIELDAGARERLTEGLVLEISQRLMSFADGNGRGP